MRADTRERYARGQWVSVSDWWEMADEDRRAESRALRDSKYEDTSGSAALGYKRGVPR
jgi:hypothetical protein